MLLSSSCLKSLKGFVMIIPNNKGYRMQDARCRITQSILPLNDGRNKEGLRIMYHASDSQIKIFLRDGFDWKSIFKRFMVRPIS